jgi:Family of unknown function (DUF6292)
MTAALLDPADRAGQPEHRPLWKYLVAVTHRLGIGAESVAVDHDTPVSGYLALDTRLPGHPDRDVALLWDERHGWCAAVETHSGEDLLVLAHLGGDTVLPEPDAVARFLNDLTRRCPRAPGPPPAIRTARTGDDLADLLDRLGWAA